MIAYRIRRTSVLILLSALSIPLAAQADTPEELAKIYACREISDDLERLACFDKSVGTLQEAEATGNVVALSKDSIQTTRREGFGLDLSGLSRLGGIFGSSDKKEAEAPKVTDLTPDGDGADVDLIETDKNGEITRIGLTVAKTQEINHGRYRIFFDNGQVWETRESKHIRFRKAKDGSPVTATIRKAFGGSFMMRVNGKGAGIRVRRVK